MNNEAARRFKESISTAAPRGPGGVPDTSAAETVAEHNKRLNTQHAARRALSAARVRAGELEHAIRQRRIALGVANHLHELPREGKREARLAVHDADDRLTALRDDLAAVEAQIVERAAAVAAFGEG